MEKRVSEGEGEREREGHRDRGSGETTRKSEIKRETGGGLGRGTRGE